MDALNKLGSAILKAAVCMSLFVGTTSLTGQPADHHHPEGAKMIHSEKVDKAENFKRFGEFVNKVREQEERIERVAGPEE